MRANRPTLSKHQLDSFVITVCCRYRKGMPIVNATRDAVDDHPWLTANAVSRIRNAAVKALKANSEWDYNRPEVG